MDRKARNGQSLTEFLIVLAIFISVLAAAVTVLQASHCIVEKNQFSIPSERNCREIR